MPGGGCGWDLDDFLGLVESAAPEEVNEAKTRLVERLAEEAGPGLAKFQASLSPTLPPSMFGGVSMAAIRGIAAEFRSADLGALMLYSLCPTHESVEQILLREMIAVTEKRPDLAFELTGRCRPFLLDWSTVDSLTPSALKKTPDALIAYARELVASEPVYERRHGVRLLESLCMDGALYDPANNDLVASVRTDAYYLQMMVGWYFATLLAKHPKDAMAHMESGSLQDVAHNMAIQKARSSSRVDEKLKSVLEGMRRPASSPSLKY